MTWIITQDMMDRACAIFTQTTGNPLRDAKRIGKVTPWAERPVTMPCMPEDEIYDLRAMLDYYGVSQDTTEPPAPKEQVQWGIDWGKQGDRTAVSIVKRHPDGTIEVVAIEVEPVPTFTTERSKVTLKPVERMP